MDKKVVLTREGLKNLEDELQELKITRRKEIAEKIKEARSQGDLSENAEYDSAKDEQAEVEARIINIEKMLRNAEVIDDSDVDHTLINVGSRILLCDMEFNDEVEYLIVGSAEANPMQGKISNESPLGRILLGHRAGEIVEVNAPAGIIKYKIAKIL